MKPPSVDNDIQTHSMLTDRKFLPHEIPSWVPDGAIFFLTLCTTPRGKNQLCYADAAASLWESVQFREERQEWWVHLLLLMPDHLHALVSFSPDVAMKHSVAQWKRYAASRFGIRWQRDFFDHRLRSDESHQEKAKYIRMNPVRVGLAAFPEDWPYVWSKQGFEG